MNAIDTNVFVYLHDGNEPTKRATAKALIGSLVPPPQETVLLWQVAAELLSCLRKWESAGKMSAPDVEANFRNVLALFPLHRPTANILNVSFDLRAKFSLSHWDSLLLAACKEIGANILYSEDLSTGTDYDGVKVINPFSA